MKKIQLTESQLITIIEKIVNEQTNDVKVDSGNVIYKNKTFEVIKPGTGSLCVNNFDGYKNEIQLGKRAMGFCSPTLKTVTMRPERKQELFAMMNNGKDFNFKTDEGEINFKVKN
jgi:hypothetical protein